MAVQFRDTETPGVALRPLLDEDLFVMGDPPARELGSEACPMRELDGVPMVLPLAAQGLRTLIERSFAQADLELNVIGNVDAFWTSVAIARAGSACTILPLSALTGHDPAERPSVRLLVEPGIRRPVSLACSTSLPRTSAATAVQGIIIDLVEELVLNKQWAGARLRLTET
jgi:LysR family nitrogen assimilation transcriptional regulator